jgi:hypothetical protein
MLIDTLRKYVTTPVFLYSQVRILDEYNVLNYNLEECEQRILKILSYGQEGLLHTYADSLPWHEFEELLGDRLNAVLNLAQKRRDWASQLGRRCNENIFERYMAERRAYYMP